MAKIVIHHLASIHHIEMDIRQMNILIGEQATGKSTLCKAIYFFRNLKNTLIDYFYMVGQHGEGSESGIEVVCSRWSRLFVEIFGHSWKLPKDLSMAYYYTEKFFAEVKLVTMDGSFLGIDLCKDLRERLEAINSYAVQFYHSTKTIKDKDPLLQLENKKFYTYLEHEISEILNDDMTTYYLPAGRGLLSLLCNQRTYLNYEGIDPINRKFMQTIESLQDKFEEGTAKVHKYFPGDDRKFNAENISSEIIRGMKGEYFFQRGKEYLQIPNSDEQIPINYASSGQQEILWLYNQLFMLMLRDEKAFVIIEEPEAHLYPILQKNIVDFIVKFINITGSSAIVTTHSPYILTEANNLYITGRLRENQKIKKDVEDITGQWSYIEENALNAYELSSAEDGTKIQSLIDKDTGELLVEKIDDISSEINETYTKLFYLEEDTEDE